MNKQERLSKIVRDYLPYLVFVGMFIFLFMQYRLVGPQFDDYGYYTLNYMSAKNHVGTEYSFAELFAYLKEHYFVVNGRLFYDGIWLSLFKIGGNKLIQFIAALTVTVVFGLMYRIGMDNSALRDRKCVLGVLCAGALCVGYGGIDVLLHQHGTYWYAAFFTYYMPLVPLLLFVFLYDKWYGRFDAATTLLLSLLSFASAWSGETLSVGVVLLMVVLAGMEFWKKKRLDTSHILFFGAAVAGLAILLCSPGIQNRAGDKQWGLAALGSLLDNARIVFGFMFFEGNRRYWLFVFGACFFLALVLYLRKRCISDLVCVALLAAMEMLTALNYSMFQVLICSKWGMTILCVIFILGTLIMVVGRHYYYVGDRKQPMILFAVLMSVVSLVAVPEIQHRVILPFEICTLLLIFEACKELYLAVIAKDYLSVRKWLRIGLGVCACLFVAALSYVSLKNSLTIYNGYKTNAVIHEYNESVILEAKEAMDQGVRVENIVLKKLPDDRYASIMLYQQDGFRTYVNSYYELPQGTTYTFE